MVRTEGHPQLAHECPRPVRPQASTTRSWCGTRRRQALPSWLTSRGCWIMPRRWGCGCSEPGPTLKVREGRELRPLPELTVRSAAQRSAAQRSAAPACLHPPQPQPCAGYDVRQPGGSSDLFGWISLQQEPSKYNETSFQVGRGGQGRCGAVQGRASGQAGRLRRSTGW